MYVISQRNMPLMQAIFYSLAATVCLLLHEWGSCWSKQFAIKFNQERRWKTDGWTDGRTNKHIRKQYIWMPQYSHCGKPGWCRSSLNAWIWKKQTMRVQKTVIESIVVLGQTYAWKGQAGHFKMKSVGSICILANLRIRTVSALFRTSLI